MANNSTDLERRLWDAADELRANSKLNASEYSVPVLGLIFLRYADAKFDHADQELAGRSSGRRQIGKADYQARGVLYLPPEARFKTLLRITEGANVGQAINDAMRAIEGENPDLKDVLPKTYNRLENATLLELLQRFLLGVGKKETLVRFPSRLHPPLPGGFQCDNSSSLGTSIASRECSGSYSFRYGMRPSLKLGSLFNPRFSHPIISWSSKVPSANLRIST